VIPVTAGFRPGARISSYLGLLNQGENTVADNQSTPCPRLWISYPWIRNEERDFTYLVPQLKAANIEAIYDSFQLQPDLRLGERIVQRLMSIGLTAGSTS